MAKDMRILPPGGSGTAPPRAPRTVEFEGIEEELPREEQKASLTVAPPRAAVAEPTQFTRCFRVSNVSFGGLQVKCDSAEEAFTEFLRKKAPGLPADEVKRGTIIQEVLFVPAETEAHKPHGWLKKKLLRGGK